MTCITILPQVEISWTAMSNEEGSTLMNVVVYFLLVMLALMLVIPFLFFSRSWCPRLPRAGPRPR